MAASRKFMPHFHVPLQSGANDILGLMRRRYKRELYAERVAIIKSLMPHCAIGVDVIVVDKRPRPLEFLDFEIIDELVYQMRQKDVVFRLGEAVSNMSIVDDGGRPQGLIELESGKNIVADMILFSAGRVGATDSLNLEAAGLKACTPSRRRLVGMRASQAAGKPVRCIAAMATRPASV